MWFSETREKSTNLAVHREQNNVTKLKRQDAESTGGSARVLNNSDFCTDTKRSLTTKLHNANKQTHK